jgi:hypothetical protein
LTKSIVRNETIKTYRVLINEVHAEKSSDLPSIMENPLFIGVSAREVMFRDLP